MNIEQLTIKEAREIAAIFNKETNPSHETKFWEIGQKYFIRTVTHHYTGILRYFGPQEIILFDAAWIADDGRFTQAVATGEFNEVEMFPPGTNILIGRSAILDATPITTIPTSQK